MNEVVARLKANIENVILGKPKEIELALVALLARGHLLLDDIPGVGKTTLAICLARSINCEFRRIQFTSDMLPSDVIGVSIFSQKSSEFEFKPGPLFANIVLADEINRTTPKTQSALLEAMNEAQVTVDNKTYSLPKPFLVIATQNPLEFHGTYPLPESQLDRFLMSFTIGYPDRKSEIQLLKERRYLVSKDGLSEVATADEILQLQKQTDQVRLDDAILDYFYDIIEATRKSERVAIGASPRGGLALKAAAQAYALIQGRDYVTPDDVKVIAVSVLAHRIEPKSRSGDTSRRIKESRTIVQDILASTRVPM